MLVHWLAIAMFCMAAIGFALLCFVCMRVCVYVFKEFESHQHSKHIISLDTGLEKCELCCKGTDSLILSLCQQGSAPSMLILSSM